MKKRYLIWGMAVCTMGMTMVSCADDDQYDASKGIKNAEQVLGLSIDPNQDWKMTTEVTANIAVNLGLDQNYTVVVYNENPLYNKNATYYLRQTVAEGEVLTRQFSVPLTTTRLYVATYDSKYRRIVNVADVEDNRLTVKVGGSATTRAVEDASVYPDFVKTLDNYLNPDVNDVKELIRQNNQIAWSADYYSVGAEVSLAAMKEYTALTNELITNETGGNHTISDKYYDNGAYSGGDYPGHGDGKHFRVPAGTELTESFNINATQYVINDAVIYVEGKLHLNGNTLNGPTIVIGAGGEVVLDGTTNMSNAGRFVIMAGGKLTGADGVEFNINNGGACYNAGTIEFNGTLNVNGSNTYNNGTIKVDILRNTAGGKFTNFGKITARTNTVQGDAYNSTIVNGCYLHFTENAGVGSITLLDNSRIDVDGQLYITGGLNGSTPNKLYNLSEINAGSVYCQNAVVEGPTTAGEFAVFKTSKMLVSYGGDFLATNNVYVDWNSDECYQYDGTTNYKAAYSDNDYQYTAAGYIVNNNIPNWSTEASASITIPAGDCTGSGYNDTTTPPDDKIIGEPEIYTFAFEDSFVGDYDMNDVVLQVRENPDDPNKIDVILCATGAMYDLSVNLRVRDELLGRFTYRDLQMFNGEEVHSALGAPKGKFINTGTTDNIKFFDAEPVTYTFKKPSSNFDIATADFWIKSPQGEIHVGTTYGTGTAPYGLIIPKAWRWPKEWNTITGNSERTSPYPNFAGFASDRTTNQTWYDVVDEDLVY